MRRWAEELSSGVGNEPGWDSRLVVVIVRTGKDCFHRVSRSDLFTARHKFVGVDDLVREAMVLDGNS